MKLSSIVHVLQEDELVGNDMLQFLAKVIKVATYLLDP